MYHVTPGQRGEAAQTAQDDEAVAFKDIFDMPSKN